MPAEGDVVGGPRRGASRKGTSAAKKKKKKKKATSSKSESSYAQLHDDYLSSLDYESLTPSQFQEQINNHRSAFNQQKDRLHSAAVGGGGGGHDWDRARREAMLQLLKKRPAGSASGSGSGCPSTRRSSQLLSEEEQERLLRLRDCLLSEGLSRRRFSRRVRALRRIEMAQTYDEDGVPDRNPDEQHRRRSGNSSYF